jgi:8-oxo-dGTP pyrophosphatase MutT (NUDIX family)
MKNAAGTIVVDSLNRVLLRRPTNCYGGYHWTIAKGGVDAGETAQQAALRETREEMGWEVEIVASLGQFGGDTSTTEVFIARPVRELAEGYHYETEAVAWVSLARAAGLIHQTTSDKGRARDLAILEAAKAALSAGKLAA